MGEDPSAMATTGEREWKHLIVLVVVVLLGLGAVVGDSLVKDFPIDSQIALAAVLAMITAYYAYQNHVMAGWMKQQALHAQDQLTQAREQVQQASAQVAAIESQVDESRQQARIARTPFLVVERPQESDVQPGILLVSVRTQASTPAARVSVSVFASPPPLHDAPAAQGSPLAISSTIPMVIEQPEVVTISIANLRNASGTTPAHRRGKPPAYAQDVYYLKVEAHSPFGFVHVVQWYRWTANEVVAGLQSSWILHQAASYMTVDDGSTRAVWLDG